MYYFDYTHVCTQDKNSSVVEDFRYNYNNRELLVMLNGSCYVYQDVSLFTFENFDNAFSFGQFYNERISGKYAGSWVGYSYQVDFNAVDVPSNVDSFSPIDVPSTVDSDTNNSTSGLDFSDAKVVDEEPFYFSLSSTTPEPDPGPEFGTTTDYTETETFNAEFVGLSEFTVIFELESGALAEFGTTSVDASSAIQSVHEAATVFNTTVKIVSVTQHFV